MDEEARILLDDVIAFCERDGIDTRIVSMLRQCDPTSLDEVYLSIAAPSRFAQAAILRHTALIEQYLEEIAFMPLKIDVGVKDRPAAGTAAPVQPSPAAAPSPADDPSTRGCPPHEDALRETPTAEPTARTVTNSVSPADFARLMAQMSDDPAPAQVSAALPDATGAQTLEPPAEEEGASCPVDSKYTFETFVRGDENKLALDSAQRFCAFSEVPGVYDILFIYGRSGVGKTHLLLAVKNHLAEKAPHIKVKYANSQNYLDDYIGEVTLGHGGGRRILPEYHDANILIIDDIQNIIGKQQSVEHFFTLMDEYIRENKKIAIASDRAPKELAMDERLTSRFNSGMLCPIAEPGYEMKCAILKRYYENTLKPMGTATYANVDQDLLDSLSIDCGKLTDEQLRFMAEVSGDNIRELESFCERCAHESLEKEQAGLELTGEDIKRIAEQYFDTTQKVIRIETVQNVVEDFYQVTHDELIGPKRQARIAFARHMAVYLANELCNVRSQSAIGAAFGGRDHSTVINSIKVVDTKMREDRRVFEEHQRLRDKIQLKA